MDKNLPVQIEFHWAIKLLIIKPYRVNQLWFFCYSLESTKSAILPELVELANDEESSVRLAGLDTVVSVLNLLDEGLLYWLLPWGEEGVAC